MRPKLLIVAVLVLAAGGAFWWWQSAAHRQSIAIAALPPAPPVEGVHPALREELDAAEKKAHSLTDAPAGLADLALLYHANGYLEEAMSCYTALAELQPREARWPHLHATILAGYGEVEAAISLWQRTVELAPDYLPARLRLGDAALKANDLATAKAAYEGALKQSPDDPYAQLGLARLDLEAGRDSAARPRLEAIVRQTNYQLGYDLIVSLYERTGELQRAAAIRGAAKASGAYRDPPDPWADALMEKCYDSYRIAISAGAIARTGDTATALRLLERAVALAPNDVSAHFQLGSLFLQTGRLDAARDRFARCTTLAPDFSDGWSNLSETLAKMGDHQGAARALAAGLSNCPTSPGLHLLRARRLREAGRNEEAIAAYTYSIQLRPHEPPTYLELGNLLISLGRVDEGIQQMRAALALDPADPHALTVMAFQTISLGDRAEADQWLNRIAQQPRASASAFQQLQDLYRKKFGAPASIKR